MDIPATRLVKRSAGSGRNMRPGTKPVKWQVNKASEFDQQTMTVADNQNGPGRNVARPFFLWSFQPTTQNFINLTSQALEQSPGSHAGSGGGIRRSRA